MPKNFVCGPEPFCGAYPTSSMHFGAVTVSNRSRLIYTVISTAKGKKKKGKQTNSMYSSAAAV